MELGVAALTYGLRTYDFQAFGMWPLRDDVTYNVQEVTSLYLTVDPSLLVGRVIHGNAI